jgi:hypothetical protein
MGEVMTAPIVEKCAHRRVIPDSDPDYRYCWDCLHTVFVGVPLDIPLLHAKPEEKPVYVCIDCGKTVGHRETTRCRVCQGIQTSIRQTGKKTKNNKAFGYSLLTPRETNVVAGRKGSGL